MKRSLIGLIALMMSPLFAPQANAERTSNVQTLLAACTEDSRSFDFTYCLGYVGGTADTMAVNGWAAKKAGTPATLGMTCISSPAPTYGAYVQAFVNWAQAHPKNWQESLGYGVMEALSQTWPCQ
ncbi:hypothetical protein BPNPMPFG_005036 [Mesorhizobium sp. AR07]|uniref:Rap1a/Tai family immunity protein n=1 Tax=Mesorhizobium sp. AR07 TaxID=2865838 RepID=UPI00215E2E85|nr:Rap1a/Tai family immunity protein [Mesorhizobium sp. AR07]UVK43258.1 hypothetical protein BPNPMPFG_005036 [Mesorhizobium sp. AR07]